MSRKSRESNFWKGEVMSIQTNIPPPKGAIGNLALAYDQTLEELTIARESYILVHDLFVDLNYTRDSSPDGRNKLFRICMYLNLVYDQIRRG